MSQTTHTERIYRLLKLKEVLEARSAELFDALDKDLKRDSAETQLLELFPTLSELKVAIRKVKRWMKPQPIPMPINFFPSKGEVRYEARGNCLIIGPWNYPFSLVMIPTINALAAGNTVIIKPSELAPHTSTFIASLIRDVFPPEEVTVVEGDAETSHSLLELPFDHFFYTGGGRVGRIVMEAAAKHLASVTLELGGKSPAIVDRSADLAMTAQNLVWGKFVNAGQTCVAPDYVLVPRELEADLLRRMRLVVESFYGHSEAARQNSTNFARIINDRHFLRIKSVVEKSLSQGAKLEVGGQFDAKENFVAPTILSGVRPDHPVMEEELFGPVMPVLSYKDRSEVYDLIRAKAKPLALYVFAEDSKVIEEVLHNTTSGGVTVNGAVVHVGVPELPFGGVGASGMGNYHGHFGFKTFSHERSVFYLSRWTALKFFFPPYTARIRRLLKWVMRFA